MVIPFNKRISELSAKDFLQQYITPLNLKKLIVGYDFKFGNKGQGNIDLLTQWGKENDCKIIEIPIQKHNENTPYKIESNSKQLKVNPNLAFQLLGHPYILIGTVISGEKGRRDWVPNSQHCYRKTNAHPD